MTDPAPMSGPDIETLLAAHVFIRGFLSIGGWVKSQCTCGHEYDNPNASEFASHPAHVAAVLRAHIVTAVQSARGEAVLQYQLHAQPHVVRQAQESAWDEGAQFMDEDTFWFDGGRNSNPYRVGQIGADHD